MIKMKQLNAEDSFGNLPPSLIATFLCLITDELTRILVHGQKLMTRHNLTSQNRIQQSHSTTHRLPYLDPGGPIASVPKLTDTARKTLL